MSQAFDLMIAGMGFVFVFLTILVGVTNVMSKVAAKLEPPAPAIPAAKPAAAAPAASVANDAKLLAVISAAVAQHRSRHKK